MLAKHIKSVGIFFFLLFLTSGVQATVSDDSANEPKWAHDPFRYITPAVDDRSLPVDLVEETTKPVDTKGLQGIFVSNGLYQALYDGQLVKAGERIGSVLIHKIAPYSIVIEDGAGRRSIELFNEK